MRGRTKPCVARPRKDGRHAVSRIRRAVSMKIAVDHSKRCNIPVEANMGLGPFGMTHARSQVADFTLPIFREVLHILTARPRPQPQPWGFLAPFT
ncbi:hypothetical protein E2C01_063216 [Portunus trituberculatus]|uniref:Uncharacterized protein n=1 Tax=Portunus trituberculatus TaxID=210409 RepID=A0A5B7HD37_PORTR|nr:hypothetical protein [Portunus trituberculatus]